MEGRDKFEEYPWLEQKIKDTMKALDTAVTEGENINELVSLLDKFVSIKKKWNEGTDKYGETMRVMEDFGFYVNNNYPKKANTLRKIMEEYMKFLAS